MSYVSLAMPFVIGYVFIAWRSLTRKKITIEEIENDKMSY
jgi:cytochrome d ubiquinol oxidase subunit II